MPNKYSHSVVLAHYSSLGLIDLPNDQYIAYLKTYPASRRTSIASRHTAPANGTRGSINPSAGYNSRYRISEEPTSSSRSVASRREPVPRIKRDVIIESDEGSGDERVILGKKYEPIRPSSRSQERVNGQNIQTEKKKPRSVSTYTGRSSSPESERAALAEVHQQVSTPAKGEQKRSPASVINLNEYDATPGRPAPELAFKQPTESSVAQSSDLTDNIAAQVKPVNRTNTSQETRIHDPSIQTEPSFDDFSQQHFSEVAITGDENARSIPSPIVSRSHFSRPSTARKPISPSPSDPSTLGNRRDSVDSFDLSPPKIRYPRHSRSFDSISSYDSEDIRHSTTALPPIVQPKSQKPLRTRPGTINLTARDPKIREDVIDPSFFEALRNGPQKPFVSTDIHRSAGLQSKPPRSDSMHSQQQSRRSSDAAATQQSGDFWRGLEDMLSDSDASVVFPPDIAKYKPRDSNVALSVKADKTVRNENMNDGESKRPTTAPAPRTSTREASKKEAESFPERLNAKARNVREVTTVQLVDTSAQKKGKGGFLRKLRKRSYNDGLKA